jgi:hypothetical protein
MVTDESGLIRPSLPSQLNQAGWKTSSGLANTPGPGGRQVWSWTNSSYAVVRIMVTDDPGGGAQVTVTWLAL